MPGAPVISASVLPTAVAMMRLSWSQLCCYCCDGPTTLPLCHSYVIAMSLPRYDYFAATFQHVNLLTITPRARAWSIEKKSLQRNRRCQKSDSISTANLSHELLASGTAWVMSSQFPPAWFGWDFRPSLPMSAHSTAPACHDRTFRPMLLEFGCHGRLQDSDGVLLDPSGVVR